MTTSLFRYCLVLSLMPFLFCWSGCAAVQTAFGVPATQLQVTNCLNWIAQQATQKLIPSAQLSADLTALGATPPTLPADCNNHT